MRKSLWTVALLLAAIGVPAAHADSIAYTVSDTATGTIGSVAFTDALVTITFVGNTSNVTGGPINFLNSVGTGTADVAGIGTFSFTDALETFASQGVSAAGISDATLSGFDILDTFNSALGTYALTTAIGPVSGASATNIGTSFATAGGSLTFSSIGTVSTFTATTGAATTPEPSCLLLLGASLLGLAPLRRKIQR